LIRLSRRGVLIGAAALATSTLPAASATGTQYDLKGRMQALEREKDCRIGAYALDVGNGRTVRYRGDERFPMLSTFKAFLGAALLDRSRYCEPGLLRKRLYWAKSELVANSPITSQHIDDGLTVAELCWAAICVSDNTAANVLLKQIGGPDGLTCFIRQLGDPVTRLDRWEIELNNWSPSERRDTTTPAAAGRNLRLLTVGGALHPADRTQLIAWMRAARTGAKRIRAGLPKTWVVGDKTGTSSSYGSANDIAIAHPRGGAPLILAIYTNRSQPTQVADETIIATTATALAQALGRR
jgi:beta-lactamase class A